MTKFLFRYNLHILTVYFLLTFPMFYFVYKFGILLQGYDDAKSYLKLFENLSSTEVPSPFNMRLLASSIVHVMEKTGLMYNTECSMDAFGNVSKPYFFNNLLFNFICIFLTSFSIFLVFFKLGISKVLSFIAGLTFLLGFGTIFYLMMPGVDALSVLIFTWIIYFYFKRSYWITFLFMLLIFQREYYFLVFMVIALMDYFKNKREKYFLNVFLISILSFGIYYVLRKTFFYTDHWNHQTSPAFLMSSLFEIKMPLVPMIRQTLMTMNIYFIYLLILTYKYAKGFKIEKHHFYISLAVFVEITLLSFAATFGNNNGRYFYLNTPLILYFLVIELSTLINSKKFEI